MSDDAAANARGSPAAGTSAGTIACCEGICSARATPSSTHMPKMTSRPIQPCTLPQASTSAAAAWTSRLVAST